MSSVRIAKIPTLTSHIAGRAVDGDGDPFLVVSPSDGTELGRPQSTSIEQVQLASAAARGAARAWAATAAGTRATILERAAAAIEADVERLANLITLDNGKTFREAELDVQATVAQMRSAAGWSSRVKGTTLVDNHGLQRLTWREPIGVVAIFMPFNAPLMFCGLKIAAAIGAGNTVVAKSPQQNPYAAAAFVEYLYDAGMPEGVVNLVQGAGDVGSSLVEQPEVDMVSFTGSSHVGALVAQAAVARHKRLILELGGKSANIVFDDADLTAAVPGSIRAIFPNAGQRCFSGSRLLLQREIADEFLHKFVKEAAALRVGDPFDPKTQVGALITRADVERVHQIVKQARDEGAEVLCGGEPVDNGSQGAFFAPTVIDCTNAPNAAVLRGEVFGPVVTVQRFDDAEEAIEIANSSEYALAGGCWTRDLSLALSTARAVDAGMFWVNSYGKPPGVELTIGGRGASGLGQEMGEEGILAYTNIKSVLIDSGPGFGLAGAAS